MHEIVIGGVSYPLNFGMGFLREVNKQAKVPVAGFPGKSIDLGFRYLYGRMTGMEDVEALETILLEGNRNQNPRLTIAALDNYIDEEVEDIDELFKVVTDFLKQTNALKKTIRMIEEEQKTQEPPES